MDNRTLGLGLIAASAVIFLSAALLKKNPVTRSRPAPAARAEQPFEKLIKNTRADIYFELTPAEQKQLVKLVGAFCGAQFDAKSCTHYLLTCGKPCFHVTDTKRLGEIVGEYNSARRQRGLASFSPREY